jgi:hypothetical protein
MPDISKLLTNSGINLESYAKNKFGANSIDTSRLPSFPSVATPAPESQQGSEGIGRTWDPTRYSAAITSGAGNLDPRTKFLFNVEFQFDDAVAQMASSLAIDPGQVSKNLSFVIKQIDLPKFEFAHEEVNQYNFRTKILKQISHKELSFSFFDDVGNNALNMLNLYLQIMSPISRGVPTTGAALGDHGMDFSSNYMPGLDSAIRGVLPNNSTQVIRVMKVHQIYIERDAYGDLNSSVFFNTYTFTNPRIISFDFSDQDHEANNAVNIITAQFDYDALNIQTRRSAKEFPGNRNPAGDILGQQTDSAVRQSQYAGLQIDNSPPMDQYAILNAKMNSYVNIDSPTIDRLPGSFGDYQIDPMMGIIKNEVEKVIARKGAMSPLQNAIYRTMSGQSGRIDQAIALPRVPYVTDNSASANVIRLLSKKITSN